MEEKDMEAVWIGKCLVLAGLGFVAGCTFAKRDIHEALALVVADVGFFITFFA